MKNKDELKKRKKKKKKKKIKQVPPYIPELQAQWRNDVEMPLRFPRIGYEDVVHLVIAA